MFDETKFYICYRANAFFKQVFFNRVRQESNCRSENNSRFPRHLFFTFLTLASLRQRYGVSGRLTSEPKIAKIRAEPRLAMSVALLQALNEDLNTL